MPQTLSHAHQALASHSQSLSRPVHRVLTNIQRASRRLTQKAISRLVGNLGVVWYFRNSCKFCRGITYIVNNAWNHTCNWKGKDNKMDASPANLHTAESPNISSLKPIGIITAGRGFINGPGIRLAAVY